MTPRLHIAGAGCALADYLYTGLDFAGGAFQRYRCRVPGDGGLIPGGLVFTEDLERFAGRPYAEALAALTDGRPPDAFNLGGPSIVALLHAAQVLPAEDVHVSYCGRTGRDETARRLRALLGPTPLDITHYDDTSERPTPFTYVLSDPTHAGGHGERTFVNNIGAAWDLGPEDLPATFCHADIACLGGTALVPRLHDALHEVLATCHRRGALTVVNTVFDFRHERVAPDRPWPLGDSTRSLPHVDLLIADEVEALRLSGSTRPADAVAAFQEAGVGAVMVTRGPAPVLLWSRGTRLTPAPLRERPVCAAVTEALRSGAWSEGDTTGCGDNFVGGVLASLAEQLLDGVTQPDLVAACDLGIVSGGFACHYAGGAYAESGAGEKRARIEPLRAAYARQVAGA